MSGFALSKARLRSDVSSRSRTTAVKNRSVMAATIRKNCTDIALASVLSFTNGPKPWIAPQIAKKLTTISAALEPLGPKRIDAQSNNGNGRYNNAGDVSWPTFNVPKLRLPTSSKPPASTAASRYRSDGALSSERIPPRLHVTIAGTNVNEARTLEKNRIRNTSQ